MKIQIVNEQDEVIGTKERGEVDYQTDIYRVSALWLTNSKGQTLLARRALSNLAQLHKAVSDKGSTKAKTKAKTQA